MKVRLLFAALLVGFTLSTVIYADDVFDITDSMVRLASSPASADAVSIQTIAAEADLSLENLLSTSELDNNLIDSSEAEGCDQCDSGCGGGCGCDAGLFGGCGLVHWVAPSNTTCFDDFITPIFNPLFFEDPRTVTEARFVFAHHRLPPALGNGEVQIYALQLRAALNDRLSIIANKDGFIIGQQGAPLNDGWADVALGLKYLLWSDPQAGRLLSGGVTFDVPIGSTQALQGNGDGEFNLFLTGGRRATTS